MARKGWKKTKELMADWYKVTSEIRNEINTYLNQCADVAVGKPARKAYVDLYFYWVKPENWTAEHTSLCAKVNPESANMLASIAEQVVLHNEAISA